MLFIIEKFYFEHDAALFYNLQVVCCSDFEKY